MDSASHLPFSLRRPALTIALTLAAVAALAAFGLDIEQRLAPISLTIAGTDSAHGQQLAERHFGQSSPFAVLLRGPANEIERQGPRLAAALRQQPEVTVLSPWDTGALAGLRPGARKALFLLDYKVAPETAMRETVPDLEATLERQVRPPLHATQSGYASISRALQHESLAATERAELLALPLLIIVLLLVFRSLVAAAIPLALGALTVLAGRGVLVLLSEVTSMQVLSLVVCTMMGLALGVDYSLLIVSRFREELARCAGGCSCDASRRACARSAAVRTRASAGRTTVFAGATLFISIFISAFLQPGGLFFSLAIALVVVTLISLVLAWWALPALLALLGPRVDAGRLPRLRPASPREQRSRVAALASRALRHPALACTLISLPLWLLAAPALAFNTGAPGVDELASDNPARRSAETIDAAVGPGWQAPFVLIAASRHGPITTPANLALLARAQRRIAAEPAVQAVLGPAALGDPARHIDRLGAVLTADGPDALPAELARAGPGLRRASSGIARIRAGIANAAAGSDLLHRGAARGQRGAELLGGGLARAAEGGERAVDAVKRLATGSERLSGAQHSASSAGLSLALELRALVPSLRGNGLRRARSLQRELAAATATDPALAGAARRAGVLASVLASLRDELRQARGSAIELRGGLRRLEAGGDRLEHGAARLAGSAAALGDGLHRLGFGATALGEGLGALQDGAGALGEGLRSGYGRSAPLQRALTRAGSRVSSATAPLLSASRRLRHSSPGLFDSGYFVLSVLDGSRDVPRALAAEAVDLEHGGRAARMLVVSTEPFNSNGSRRAGGRLLADAHWLATRGDLRTGLAGGAATLNDYGAETRARLPLVIGSIIAITFLLLVAILRAPLLAALTVALNLASVAAAIGVMSLICKLPAGYPLGGHPYIDTVGAAAIFGVTFGLSIDYAVFLLARMRESYERDGDNRTAISFGLEKTASVITGAAAIMAAVFVSFATAPIATVSQMGVGLTVAILLDATIVRIVLLPALMLLLGDRVWHVPAWLERLLPDLDLHGRKATI
jgi:RND superfamily putative drug exporter